MMERDNVASTDSEAMSSEVSSTEVKKMKQARLPFSPFEVQRQKKRRSSIGDKNPKAGKIVRKEIVGSTDIDAEVEESNAGKVVFSTKTKGEKENIMTDMENRSKDCEIINSPICKKYEADSSCNDNASERGNKSIKNRNESNKKRQKRVSNNSPSIASLFKKISDKNMVAPDDIIIQLSDSDEPQEKKIKTDESQLNTSNENNSSSDFIDVSQCLDVLINSNTLVKDIEETSQLQEKPVLSTPNQKTAIEKIKTPKQLEREEQQKVKREERHKVQAEKLKVKLEEKLKKEKVQQAKRDEFQKIKEEKTKKKLEENEAKSKEKEEKNVRKEEERLIKEFERQKKECEKQKREEEKLKKEEDKLKQEELKRFVEEEENEKKEKLKQKFAKFFVPKKVENSIGQPQNKDVDVSSGPFMMFTVKGNMKLAPLVRRELSADVKLSMDDILRGNRSKTNYLQELKQSGYVKRSSFRTLPVQEKVDDCEIIDDDCIDDVNNGLSGSDCMKSTVKAKLLLFCENRRPAYYGTWSKNSKIIKGRTPFAKEKEIFDYDYDSDDDWEEEESGESLSDSEGEEEEEPGENNYEEDNIFFVPHGYLSDDEGHEDEVEDTVNNEEKDGELQKELLKKKQEEFEIEMKQKMKPLKPKVYGCVWLHDEKSHQAYHQLLRIFTNYKAVNILGGEYPIGTTAGGDNIPHDPKDLKTNDDDAESTTKKNSKNFPEAAVPDLIRLIHGNRNGKIFLIDEFYEHVKKHNNSEDKTLTPKTPNRDFISKTKILKKIKSLGEYTKITETGSLSKHKRWTVAKDIREKYDLGELSFENTWNYFLTPREFPPENKEEEIEESAKPKSNVSLITKFTKVLTEHEKAEKMKQASPLVDKLVSGKAGNTETKNVSAESTSKNMKQQKSTSKGTPVIRNIEKFFSKIPESKTADKEFIQLD